MYVSTRELINTFEDIYSSVSSPSGNKRHTYNGVVGALGEELFKVKDQQREKKEEGKGDEARDGQ